jgi:hypothetical protein
VKKARGIDAIGPLDIERLPDQAKVDFLDIIADAERYIMRPPQVLGTIGAIASKPAGGDRVLGLLPMTLRRWSRMRSGVVESWTQQLEDHWDTALR